MLFLNSRDLFRRAFCDQDRVVDVDLVFIGVQGWFGDAQDFGVFVFHALDAHGGGVGQDAGAVPEVKDECAAKFEVLGRGGEHGQDVLISSLVAGDME